MRRFTPWSQGLFVTGLCLPLLLPFLAPGFPGSDLLLPGPPPGALTRTSLVPQQVPGGASLEAQPGGPCVVVRYAKSFQQSRPFRSQGESVALWYDGSLWFDADLPAGRSEIRVHASGTSSGGVFAHMSVLVDGRLIGQRFVGPDLARYDFDLEGGTPSKIEIRFDNDAQDLSGDRNLIVSHVEIPGVPAPRANPGSDSAVVIGVGDAPFRLLPPPVGSFLETTVRRLTDESEQPFLRLHAESVDGKSLGEVGAQVLLLPAEEGALTTWILPAEVPTGTGALTLALSSAAFDSLGHRSGRPMCDAGLAEVRVEALDRPRFPFGWVLFGSFLLLPGLPLVLGGSSWKIGFTSVTTALWLSFFVQGALGWGLVAIDRYSFEGFCGGLLGLSLLSLLWIRRRPAPLVPTGGDEPRWLLGLAPALLFCVLAPDPSQVLLGSSDSGTYLATAAELARTGRFAVDRADLRELSEPTRVAVVSGRPGEDGPRRGVPAPGYYMLPDGFEVPQFPFYYPALLARTIRAVGLRDAYAWNTFTAALGILTVMLLVRQVWSQGTAMFCGLFLAVNASQHWVQTECLSEPATQVLLFGGMAWWCHWDSTGCRKAALIGGAALGMLLNVRIDSFTMYPGLLLLLGLSLANPDRRGSARIATSAFVLAIAAAILVGLSTTEVYVRDVLAGVPMPALGGPWWSAWAVAIVGSALATLGVRLLERRWQPAWTPPLASICSVGLVALALWAAFVRPPLDTTAVEAANLVRLGWYTTELGLWLGVAGVAGAILQVRDRRALMVLVSLLCLTMLYLQRSRITVVHPYWSRRFVVAAIPLACIGAACLLDMLRRKERLGALAAWTLALALLGGGYRNVQGMGGGGYFSGLSEQLQSLTQGLPGGARLVLPFHRDSLELIPALRHVFGIEAYTIGDPSLGPALRTEWAKAGHASYWMTFPDRPSGDSAELGVRRGRVAELHYEELGTRWQLGQVIGNPIQNLFRNPERLRVRLTRMEP